MLRRTRSITKIIEGNKFVFTLTSNPLDVWEGVHYAKRWTWTINGEDFGTAKTTDHIRRSIPYNLKAI